MSTTTLVCYPRGKREREEKGSYRRAAGMGYVLNVNGYHFPSNKGRSLFVLQINTNGSLSTCKIHVYEYVKCQKYMNKCGFVSFWLVYEWMSSMGWVAGTPAARPHPKSLEVTPSRVTCLNWPVQPGSLANLHDLLNPEVLFLLV